MQGEMSMPHLLAHMHAPNRAVAIFCAITAVLGAGQIVFPSIAKACWDFYDRFTPRQQIDWWDPFENRQWSPNTIMGVRVIGFMMIMLAGIILYYAST